MALERNRRHAFGMRRGVDRVAHPRSLSSLRLCMVCGLWRVVRDVSGVFEVEPIPLARAFHDAGRLTSSVARALFALQHALPADNRLIASRQAIQNRDSSDVLRR